MLNIKSCKSVLQLPRHHKMGLEWTERLSGVLNESISHPTFLFLLIFKKNSFSFAYVPLPVALLMWSLSVSLMELEKLSSAQGSAVLWTIPWCAWPGTPVNLTRCSNTAYQLQMGVQTLGANELQWTAYGKKSQISQLIQPGSCQGHWVISGPSNDAFCFTFSMITCSWSEMCKSVSSFLQVESAFSLGLGTSMAQ